jgi:hypothetical protein
VINEEGRLAGIAVAKIRDTQIGFAIPHQHLDLLCLPKLEEVRWNETSRQGDRIMASVSGVLADPLLAVEKLGLLVTTAPKDAGLPERDASGRWNGIADLKAMKVVPIYRKAMHANLQLPAASKDQRIIYQPVFFDASGEARYGAPAPLAFSRLRVRELVRDNPFAPVESKLEDWLTAIARPKDEFGKPCPAEATLALRPASTKLPRYEVLDAEFENVELRSVLVSSKGPVAFDGAKNVYAIGPAGGVQRLTLPNFKVQAELSLQDECSLVGCSAAGVVVRMAKEPRLLVLDRESLHVKRQILVAGINEVVLSPGSRLGFVPLGAEPSLRIAVIDFHVGGIVDGFDATMILPPQVKVPVHPTALGTPRRFHRLTLSLDGEHAFCADDGSLSRFKIEGARLQLLEVGPKLGTDFESLAVSPSGSLICPCAGKLLPQLKDLEGFGKRHALAATFAGSNLRRPTAELELLAPPHALAFGKDGQALVAYSYGELFFHRPDGSLRQRTRIDIECRQLFDVAGAHSCLIVGRDKITLVDYDHVLGDGQ